MGMMPAERTPQPIGAFGANKHGLLDLAGNVWELIATCFVRVSLEQGRQRVTTVNYGVRVVEGAHRTYMTDFVRAPCRRLRGQNTAGQSRVPPR